MFKLMLLKLLSILDFAPLRKDWTLGKAGTLHKQKKLHRFQTISFCVNIENIC